MAVASKMRQIVVNCRDDSRLYFNKCIPLYPSGVNQVLETFIGRIPRMLEKPGSPLVLTGLTALALSRIGSKCRVLAALKIRQRLDDVDLGWRLPELTAMKHIGDAKIDFVNEVVEFHVLGEDYTFALPWTEWEQFDPNLMNSSKLGDRLKNNRREA